MSKLAFFIVLLFQVLTFAHGKIGNGGGGCRLASGQKALFDQQVLFNDNQLKLTPQDMISYQNSDLFKSLMTDFKDIKGFLPFVDQFLFYVESGIIKDNRYVNVTAEELKTPAFQNEIERIKNIYVKTTTCDYANIFIYALTNDETGKTYLLPDFYNLTAIDQKIALFHEMLWVYWRPLNLLSDWDLVEPKLYTKILAVEKAFKDYYKNKSTSHDHYSLMLPIAESLDSYISADAKYLYLGNTFFHLFEDDQKGYRLPADFRSVDVTLGSLFGPKFVNCIQHSQKIDQCKAVAQAFTKKLATPTSSRFLHRIAMLIPQMKFLALNNVSLENLTAEQVNFRLNTKFVESVNFQLKGRMAFYSEDRSDSFDLVFESRLEPNIRN